MSPLGKSGKYAEDYTGGFDMDKIQINDPVILELTEIEGEPMPEEPRYS